MLEVNIFLNFYSNEIRLMKGSGYIFGFLIPSSILLFVGLYMAFTARKIAKISAGMQIDSRVRNKLEKRRGLQINLFIRVSASTIILLLKYSIKVYECIPGR